VDSQGTIYIGSIRGVPGGTDLWRWDQALGPIFDGAPNPDKTLPFRYEGQPDACGIQTNGCANNRLGVTVSRKISPTAVSRNRAKRLLRETFRLKSGSLENLKKNYDWVLNGRQALVSVKIGAPLEEFDRIVERVAADEWESV